MPNIQERTYHFPRTFDKKQLCHALRDCVYPSGECNYIKLRTHYLTDAILQIINIEPKMYRRTSLFNTVQSRKLIKEFDLLPEDFY